MLFSSLDLSSDQSVSCLFCWFFFRTSSSFFVPAIIMVLKHIGLATIMPKNFFNELLFWFVVFSRLTSVIIDVKSLRHLQIFFVYHKPVSFCLGRPSKKPSRLVSMVWFSPKESIILFFNMIKQTNCPKFNKNLLSILSVCLNKIKIIPSRSISERVKAIIVG